MTTGSIRTCAPKEAIGPSLSRLDCPIRQPKRLIEAGVVHRNELARSAEEVDMTEDAKAPDAPADAPVANQRPSPPPHEAGYEKVERRAPMEQDEDGNDVGEGSETHTGITGHKGR